MKKLSKLTAQAAVAVSLLSVAAPTFTTVAQASEISADTLSDKDVNNAIDNLAQVLEVAHEADPNVDTEEMARGVMANTGVASTVDIPTNKASQTKTLDQETIKKIDPYVSVKGNQYFLENSVKNVISQKAYATAQALISQANTFIQESDMVVNKQTKIATNDFTLTDDSSLVKSKSTSLLAKTRKRKNHNGVNSISVHWNYIHIRIDKSNANMLKNGTIGVATLFGSKIPDSRVKVISAFILGVLAGKNINRCVWFDFNFMVTGLSRWGWQ